MHQEIKHAISFLESLLKSAQFKYEQMEIFRNTLTNKITSRCRETWDDSQPIQGNAYRAITNYGRLDDVILEAVSNAGMEVEKVIRCFPTDFVLWIDPGQVSYRMGDYGSICVIYEPQETTQDKPVQTKQITPKRNLVNNIKISAPLRVAC